MTTKKLYGSVDDRKGFFMSVENEFGFIGWYKVCGCLHNVFDIADLIREFKEQEADIFMWETPEEWELTEEDMECFELIATIEDMNMWNWGG